MFISTEFWKCNKFNCFFFYLILIQIKNNVFDQKEYIKAVVFRVGWPTQNNRQKKSKFHNLKIFGY